MCEAYELLGAEPLVIGGYDIAAAQRRMNSATQMTVSMARALLGGGSAAINMAREAAKETASLPALPGGTARDNVYWKLDWHDKELAKQGDPNAFYASAADLKKWVMQAFIELNAVEAGRQWSEDRAQIVWDNMWLQVESTVLQLPQAVRQAVGQAVYWTTGVPVWGWLLGGGVLLAAAGYGIVRLAPTVAPLVADRYLPRRP